MLKGREETYRVLRRGRKNVRLVDSRVKGKEEITRRSFLAVADRIEEDEPSYLFNTLSVQLTVEELDTFCQSLFNTSMDLLDWWSSYPIDYYQNPELQRPFLIAGEKQFRLRGGWKNKHYSRFYKLTCNDLAKMTSTDLARWTSKWKRDY